MMEVGQGTQRHSSPDSSAPLSYATFVRNVLLKTLILFGILNLVFLWANPLASLGRISAYNSVLPGRARLPRHGRGHRIPPSEINYLANIDALKRIGVTDLISIGACGSLRTKIDPPADCVEGPLVEAMAD